MPSHSSSPCPGRKPSQPCQPPMKPEGDKSRAGKKRGKCERGTERFFIPPGGDSKNDLAFLPEETAMGPVPIPEMKLPAVRSQRFTKPEKLIELGAKDGTRHQQQDALIHSRVPWTARAPRPPITVKGRQKVAGGPPKSQRRAIKPSNIGRQPVLTYEGHGESTTPLRSRYRYSDITTI